MPIEVRHGEPDMAALVALATVLGAGQQRVPEIPRIQIGGVPSGGGGGGGGIRHERVPWHQRAWGSPVTRPSRPTPEEEAEAQAMRATAIQEATMPLELEKEKLQDELEFQGWKREYTHKQQMEITRLNDTDDIVMSQPEYADIRPQWREQYIQRMAGITGKLRPPRPGERDYPPTEDGQSTDIGAHWTDKQGNIHTREPDGTDKVQVTFDKTAAGIQRKHDDAMELKAMEQEAEDRKEKAKVRRELLMEKDPVSGARLYNPIQVEGIMRELFPTAEVGLSGAPAGQMGPTDVELEEELRRRIDAQTPWWEGPVSRGRKVLPAEMEAPPQVGQALMYAREAMEKYKTPGRIPSAVIAEIQRSKPLIDQWRRSERPRPAARPQREGEVSLAVREANARLQEAEDRYGTLDKIPPELIPALKRDLELVQQHTQGGGR